MAKLVAMLNATPAVRIEIGGHTDNVGSEEANLLLSENRAKAVVSYLISKGVAASRLTARGYGESVPVDSNDTEAGRASNRRTQMTVVE